MTFRCQFERDLTAGTSDETNFQDVGTPVTCFLWATAGRETQGAEKITVVEDLRALVPLASDVKVTDRIRAVTDRLGNVVESRRLLILSILRRADHLELLLEAVSN